MPLPNIFGTTPQNTQRPGADLDTNFNAVGATGVVPCTASGTNAITLTPFANNITIAAYANFQLFSFQGSGTSTAAVSIQVGALASLPLFPAGDSVQAAAGAILAGQYYVVAFQQALNGGSGGFAFVNALARRPTRTVELSGSGTYTPPAGTTRINVRMVGGGGGGAGSGTTPGAGGTGVTTTFGGIISASGGSGGTANAAGGGGVGGGGDINLTGGAGSQVPAITVMCGGVGGSSAFGGSGINGASSTAGTAPANSGGGGGGAGSNGTASPGGGGGAGGYCEKLITTMSASFAFTVGTGGNAGSGGTGGAPGGAGGSGIIIIDEFYN